MRKKLGGPELRGLKEARAIGSGGDVCGRAAQKRIWPEKLGAKTRKVSRKFWKKLDDAQMWGLGGEEAK